MDVITLEYLQRLLCLTYRQIVCRDIVCYGYFVYVTGGFLIQKSQSLLEQFIRSRHGLSALVFSSHYHIHEGTGIYEPEMVRVFFQSFLCL